MTVEMKYFLLLLLTAYCQYSLAQFSNVQKGDVLSINGVKGIVYAVNEDGTHGTIMSVKAFRGAKNLYCAKASYLKGLEMSDQTDGKKIHLPYLITFLQIKFHYLSFRYLIGVIH